MKKILVLLLVVLFLISCSSKNITESQNGTTSNSTNYVNSDDPSNESTTSPEPEPKPEPEPVVETDTQLGSRKNPAKIGETIVVSGTEYDGSKIEYHITLNSVIKGDEAKPIFIEENQFNEFPEGTTPFLINFSIDLVKYKSTDDSSYYVSDFDADFFGENYNEVSEADYLVTPNELGGEMYEGGSISGNISFLSNDEELKFIRWQELVWFDVNY